MANRVKRGVLSALFISILAPFPPFLNLVYVHRPGRALLCSLLVLALLLAEKALGFGSEFGGMAAGIAFVSLLWLYSAVLSLWLAFKGLSPETAQQDLGPWIVGCLLSAFLTLFLLESFPYTSHAVASFRPLAPLQQADRVIGVRMRPGEGVKPGGTVHFGDLVVVRDDDANRDYIRRVLGLPGDVLEIRGDELFRNGERLGRGGELPSLEGAAAWVVPEGSVFLQADEESADTALTGFRTQKIVVSKLLYVLWGKDRSRMGIRVN
jgi:signal peptidase I